MLVRFWKLLLFCETEMMIMFYGLLLHIMELWILTIYSGYAFFSYMISVESACSARPCPSFYFDVGGGPTPPPLSSLDYSITSWCFVKMVFSYNLEILWPLSIFVRPFQLKCLHLIVLFDLILTTAITIGQPVPFDLVL